MLNSSFFRPPKKEWFKEEFLSCLPKREPAQTEVLELEISVSEIVKAIEDLNPGKLPGPDGDLL